MAPNPFPSDDIIVSEVTHALDNALRHAEENYLQSKKTSKQEWIAKQLLTGLQNKAKNLEFDVLNIPENKKKNWLYDLIWKGRSPNDDPLLVAECNLGKNFRDIRNDFEKMLMARAELRLLITYGGNDQKDSEKALENIERLKTQIPGTDHFLFATIIDDSKGGKIFRYDYV